MRNAPGDTGWLRRGYPILPAFLRAAWGGEPVPASVLRAVGLPSLRLGALDAKVWALLEVDSRAVVLANYVATLVRSRIYFRHEGGLYNLPIVGCTLPDDFDLETLPFLKRTRNVLITAGRLADSAWASIVTAREFLGLKNAGVVTLLDFGVVIERHVIDEAARDRIAPVQAKIIAPEESAVALAKPEVIKQLFRLIQELRGSFNLEDASANDPRLPDLDVAGSTISDALSNLAARATVASNEEACAALSLLEKLHDTIKRLSHQPLESALIGLLQAVANPKHVQIMARRLGWDGLGGATLEEAAQLVRISRERVRQVEAQVLEKLSGHPYCPALDTALARLEKAARLLEPDGPAALREVGVTTLDFLPAGVMRAAEVLGRTPRFNVGRDGRAVFGVGEKEGESFRNAAKSLADTFFVASVFELQARSRDLEGQAVPLTAVRNFLAMIEGVIWLDGEKDWFWLTGRGHASGLVSVMKKILSVAGRLPLETLRNGVLRQLRKRGAVAPRRVFEGLCRAIGCAIDRDQVIAPTGLEPPDVLLSPSELILVDVLRANENVMGLSGFRDDCMRRGIGRYTFMVASSYSALLERVAPEIYALRGAPVDPSRVAFLRKATPRKEALLKDYGWTDDGGFWIGCRVTAGLVNCGVVGIPQAVTRVLGEDQYILKAADGGVVGTLTVRQGAAWGLSAFIRRRGVEEGDYLLILVDTAAEVAVVRVGSEELLAAYQDGEGEGPNQLLSTERPAMAETEALGDRSPILSD